MDSRSLYGYKDNSPYVDEPFNIINSNKISTKGVSKKLKIIPMKTNGKIGPAILSKPDKEYNFFDYDFVLEYPIKQFEGNIHEQKDMKKGGIHIKEENKGKFNALKKRTGKTTEELTHSKNPLTRKRAIFAQNMAHFKHQMGGQNALSPEQWYDQNMNAGYKLASGYGPGVTAQDQIKMGKYPSFYNPTQYSPTDTGFVNINNPSLRQGDSDYNPFIEYNIPKKPMKLKSSRSIVDTNSGRKAIDFGTNSTTYQYDDGRVVTYDKSGNELKSLKKGGGLHKFVSKYNRGGEAPQGDSMDTYIDTRNKDFVDYLAANTRKSLLREGTDEFKAQMGKQVRGDYSGPMNYPEELPPQINENVPNSLNLQPSQGNFTPNGYSGNFGDVTGPYGAYSPQTNQVPDYVSQYVNNVPNEQFSGQTESRTRLDFPDLLLAGANSFNGFLRNKEAQRQEDQLRNKSVIENTMPHNPSFRGNYNINNGAFRQDRMSYPTYKKGGQYSVDEKTLADLLSKGYKFEFVD